MEFISPPKGRLTFEEVFREIVEYASLYPDDKYRLIIGTDSQLRDSTCFVTALIVHREGKGGRYFYTRRRDEYARSLRQRIFYEASLSLNIATLFTERLAEVGADLNLEIHLDVGTNGATKSLVKEVVGMVNGSGYPFKIKPDAFGAATVADRYTK